MPLACDRPRRLAHGFLAVVAAALVAVATGAPAGADPIADADQSVEALRAEAEAASKEYFAALEQVQGLETQIAGIETELPRLRAEIRRLRATVADRAVAAYKRSDQLGMIIASNDALSAARRTQWLGRLNERDNDAFAELRRSRATLESERARLAKARRAQAAALEEVQARGRDIDAKLTEAEGQLRALRAEATRQQAQTQVPAAPGEPAAAPVAYSPTAGEHPQHNHPFLVCTRAHESGGNYGAVNPAGPYLGAYQLLQSTWNSTANHAGRLELVGVPPNNASVYDQDDMAWTLYTWQGTGPWGGRCG